MDGTEALAGTDQPAVPPGDQLEYTQQQAASAPAPQPTATPSQGQIASTPAPAYQAPTRDALPHRGGLGGMLDTIADMLSGAPAKQVSIDDQGQRHVAPGKPMTTGQKWANIGMTALTGAARGMAAPPGPAHVQQGIANGILGQIGDQKAASDKADATAQADYERRQQARTNELNYQIGLRNYSRLGLELTAMRVKGQQDQIDFSNKMIDREQANGSVDLGVAANKGEIADRIGKMPGGIQELYRHEGVHGWETYGADGKPNGIHYFLTKPNQDNLAAPDGVKPHRFDPTSGNLVEFNGVGLTNGEVAKYDRQAASNKMEYQKQQYQQAETDAKNAETKNAPTVGKKNLAEANQANAAANKDNAQAAAAAAKARADSDPEIASIGEGIARGALTEDQVPGFGTKRAAVQAYLTQHHPNLDQNSVMLDSAQRKQVNLAGNALHNLDDIGNRLQHRPDLVGKVAGLITQGKEAVGTDDRDLSDIMTALDNYALASTGAHGVRAVSARSDAKKALTNGFKNGPNGVQASIAAARGSLQNLASAGKPRGLNGSPYVYKDQPQGQQQAAPQAGGFNWGAHPVAQ